jgi:hypothetical protein
MEDRITRTIARELAAAAATGFLVGMVATGLPHARLAAQTAQESSPQQSAASNVRVFGSDAGLVLNFIKPDKTADFEAVIAKLKEALQKSDKPERKQQAASWKVFRAVEPGANGSVLYIFDINPAIHNADYTVSTILAEGFPNEVNELFKSYADSYATGQNFVNLTLVSSLGQ